LNDVTCCFVSGVFRISVRRGRCAVSVEGMRCGGKGVPFPRKKIIFCPENDKFGCVLTHFLTGRKHGQSLEALRHGFYGSIAKQSLQKRKNYPKIHSQTKGAVAPSPPEYATVLGTKLH